MKSFLCLLVLIAITVSVRARCTFNADCAENECCAAAPNGQNVCVKYLDVGEQCNYFQRTVVLFKYFYHCRNLDSSIKFLFQSCGCGPGLSCISKSAPGTQPTYHCEVNE